MGLVYSVVFPTSKSPYFGKSKMVMIDIWEKQSQELLDTYKIDNDIRIDLLAWLHV